MSEKDGKEKEEHEARGTEGEGLGKISANDTSNGPHVTSVDGFISSLMILFYTLFPSIVTRVALTFSCRAMGSHLLTAAFGQVQDSAEPRRCTRGRLSRIYSFILIIPASLGSTLIRQRRKQKLYPGQADFDPRYTVRLGLCLLTLQDMSFGIPSWRAQCCTSSVGIFETARASPQVVAASMILIVSLRCSCTTNGLKIRDTTGLRTSPACLLQLMTR